MVTAGLGNELRTEFHRSRDLVNWEVQPELSLPHHPHPLHPGNVMLTFDRIGDYVYIFGTGGLARNKPIWMWRNKAGEFPLGWWEPWGWDGARWNWGIANERTPILGGQFGELCFRYLQGNCVLSFFDAAGYKQQARTVQRPEDNWINGANVVDYVLGTQIPNPYGGYISPLSRLNEWNGMHFWVSQWPGPPHRKPYRVHLAKDTLWAKGPLREVLATRISIPSKESQKSGVIDGILADKDQEVEEFEGEYAFTAADLDYRTFTADAVAARRRPAFPELKDEYSNLWAEMAIRRDKLPEVEAIVDRIVSHKETYLLVERRTRVPWFAIAAIHNLEASGNFKRHLHNGDPLTSRTEHVPAGRPPSGNPPFTWEESAADVLEYRRLTQVTDWSIEHLAYVFEGYNGWGYRLNHPHVKSPYLWSFSNHYAKGKYVADGKWSETAVSQQCGAVVLLKRLEETGHIRLEAQRESVLTPELTVERNDPIPVMPEVNGGVDWAQDLRRTLTTALAQLARVDAIGFDAVHSDPRPVLRPGSTGDAVGTLQAMLRALQFDLAVDLYYGPATELAVKVFQRDHGLTADGIVGPMTWDALEQATAAASDREPARRYWPVGRGHIITSPWGWRPGGFHYGTDFGFPGGSEGKPVYAVQSGTVQYAGAAQGYGGPDPAGWLVIDSSRAQGGGCVEYGHIIREVAKGAHVTAGQLIARINPSSRSNGGVAPHLHLSVMPRAYDPGAKIDPMPWLGNALSPEAVPLAPAAYS